MGREEEQVNVILEVSKYEFVRRMAPMAVNDQKPHIRWVLGLRLRDKNLLKPLQGNRIAYLAVLGCCKHL